ncbi:MAG: hypothetical protein SNH27_10350 [Rikenellaceae bacterium]
MGTATDTNKVTLYYVQLHGLGEKIWTLCSKKDYERRVEYDPDGASMQEYKVIDENSLFQLLCIKEDEDGVSAMLKVKGYRHIEWFDIYEQSGSYVVEQNKIVNPTEFTEEQWDLINELLDPIANDLEEKYNEKQNNNGKI